MKKIISFLAIVCLFTGFTSFAPPPATVTDSHVEVTGPFVDFNPCNGTSVTSTGSYTVDTHVVLNGNRVNETIHLDGHLTGTDTDGNSYEVNDHQNVTANGSLTNGQFVENVTVNLNFISKGGAPNFVIHELLKVTFNANGTVTVDRTVVSEDCRG